MDFDYLVQIGLLQNRGQQNAREAATAFAEPAAVLTVTDTEMKRDSLMFALRKLVAGGQSGVDQAALVAATKVGLETGGWCPFDSSDETGPIKPKCEAWGLKPVTEGVWASHRARFENLGLCFDDEDKWARRTLLNALHSCGTVTIMPGRITDGTNLGLEVSKALGKPMLKLNLEDPDADGQALTTWIRQSDVQVLNVNGPRESSSPGIGAKCVPFFAKWLSTVLAVNKRLASDAPAADNRRQLPRFFFEPKPVGGFSPLFLQAPARRTAAVNAGDYRLYLGGGAMNRAFGELLKEQQGLQFGKVSEPYAQFHNVLLAASRAAGGKLVAAVDVPEAAQLLDELQLSAAVCQAGEAMADDTIEAATGAVFIDVFLEAKRPHRAEGNAAMLYVVGPKGEQCKGPKGKDTGPLLPRNKFLSSIEALGRRALDVVVMYNLQFAGTSPIEEVRWCLVSGGVYCHGTVSKLDVASATLRGMSAAKTGTITVTFTYDEDVFREAYELDVTAYVEKPKPISLADAGPTVWSAYAKIGDYDNKKLVDKLRVFAVSSEWVATEKVHGANFCFETDGVSVEYAKRTARLSEGEAFYAVWETMPQYHPMVLQAFRLASVRWKGIRRLLIYGEYFGGFYPSSEILASASLGKVQLGIAYSPNHHFYGFDVSVNGEGFLDFDEARALLLEAGFTLVAEPLCRGTLDECLAIDVELLETGIPSKLGFSLLDSYRIAEGIVVRPTKELGSFGGQRPLLKKKACTFWEATNQPKQAAKAKNKLAQPSLAEFLPEAAAALEVSKMYITENRLCAVVSKEGPALLQPECLSKCAGKFTKDVLDAVGADHPDLEKRLGKQSAPWKKALNAEIQQFLVTQVPALLKQLT